jgi:Domain of unknown function (DUF4372)
MAFAQLTYRDSLRDIEACLRSMQGKLYHMGFRGKVARSTLADANESRDWRIYADFAQVLIGIARPLYAHDPMGVDLEHSLYALDSTTIDLCLSLFSPIAVEEYISSTCARISSRPLSELKRERSYSATSPVTPEGLPWASSQRLASLVYQSVRGEAESAASAACALDARAARAKPPRKNSRLVGFTNTSLRNARGWLDHFCVNVREKDCAPGTESP